MPAVADPDVGRSAAVVRRDRRGTRSSARLARPQPSAVPRAPATPASIRTRDRGMTVTVSMYLTSPSGIMRAFDSRTVVRHRTGRSAVTNADDEMSPSDRNLMKALAEAIGGTPAAGRSRRALRRPPGLDRRRFRAGHVARSACRRGSRNPRGRGHRQSTLVFAVDDGSCVIELDVATRRPPRTAARGRGPRDVVVRTATGGHLPGSCRRVREVLPSTIPRRERSGWSWNFFPKVDVSIPTGSWSRRTSSQRGNTDMNPNRSPSAAVHAGTLAIAAILCGTLGVTSSAGAGTATETDEMAWLDDVSPAVTIDQSTNCMARRTRPMPSPTATTASSCARARRTSVTATVNSTLHRDVRQQPQLRRTDRDDHVPDSRRPGRPSSPSSRSPCCLARAALQHDILGLARHLRNDSGKIASPDYAMTYDGPYTHYFPYGYPEKISTLTPPRYQPDTERCACRCWAEDRNGRQDPCRRHRPVRRRTRSTCPPRRS